MVTEAPIPKDHPLRKAWESYKKTENYENTAKWAAYPEHRAGSLWSAFKEGWYAYQHMVQDRKARED